MRIRHQLRLFQVYTAVSFSVLALLSVAAFTQSDNAQKIDELTVQRLNVVDANGTLRMVISNKDRIHPGVIDGITINRRRTSAGIIFFNDEGDEVGGLTFSGSDDNGRQADARLMFDQLKGDQTIGISYGEGGGQRTAGLQVWDRSEQPLSDLVKAINAASALPEGPQRDAALKQAQAKAPAGSQRVFVGKNADKSASVALADSDGKPRLVMSVSSGGAASIAFLDASGNTVQRIPASK